MTERDPEFKEANDPNGLFTDDEDEKRMAGAGQATGRGDLERRLPTSAGPGDSSERATGSDHELPIPDYDELSVRGAKVRLDALNADELRRIRAHEEENKKRKTLIHEIDRRLR